MESYIVTIEDPALVAGITAAREAYNAGLPTDGTPIDTDEGYVNFVMNSAAESYYNQYKQK